MNTIDKDQLVSLLKEQMESNDVWKEKIREESTIPDAKEIAESSLQDNAHLERLLVARKYNEDATVNLFWEQVSFRAKYKPANIQPDDIPNALPSGAWRLLGRTQDGHVLSNYRLEHWNPDDYGDDLNESVAEYTRYVCYMIELMLAASTKQHDKFSVLFDLDGFYVSMATRSNIRAMIRRLIYVAQAQYPERLEQVYLVHAPYGFATAWKLIKPLLDQKTADKIQFVSDAELLEHIDASVLTEQYGGTHDAYPVPSRAVAEEAKSFLATQPN